LVPVLSLFATWKNQAGEYRDNYRSLVLHLVFGKLFEHFDKSVMFEPLSVMFEPLGKLAAELLVLETDTEKLLFVSTTQYPTQDYLYDLEDIESSALFVVSRLEDFETIFAAKR
jgi:hypothetical protein